MICHLQQRLRDLLGDEDGTIRPGLQALYDNLVGYQRPTTVIRWLDKSTAPAILRQLGAGRTCNPSIGNATPAQRHPGAQSIGGYRK